MKLIDQWPPRHKNAVREFLSQRTLGGQESEPIRDELVEPTHTELKSYGLRVISLDQSDLDLDRAVGSVEWKDSAQRPVYGRYSMDEEASKFEGFLIVDDPDQGASYFYEKIEKQRLDFVSLSETPGGFWAAHTDLDEPSRSVSTRSDLS